MPEPISVAIDAGAGLLSLASPCVVPLVAGYLGYLSGATVGADGQLKGDRCKVVAHARGDVAQDDYRARRTELRSRARAILQAQESIP